MADNASNNDTYIRVIYRKLRPDIKDSDARRIRYLGYIINLLVKVFLFNNNLNAFKLIINNTRKLNKLEVLRVSWRKLESVNKFYNIIKFIRVTLQRRKEFLNLLKDEIAKNIKDTFFIF